MRSAVERLLDRHDVGIGGGLAQELHHRVETFERMMDDEVLVADGGETVAAMVADAFGEARDVRLELQIGALGEDQLLEIRQAHQVLDDDDLGRRQVEMLGDELAQLAGHRGAALHVDDATPAAALEQRLEQQHQVFGFFLDFHVAVAQDAEHAPASRRMAGEQLVEIKRDHAFQRNEAHGLVLIGQTDETLQLRRHGQQSRDEPWRRGGALSATPWRSRDWG